MKSIKVVGARTHNLKNIDVEIPLGQFTVITGPSGSGKSSLAMDTIFAEGQRQYIESLSIYARQFFDQIQRPDVKQVTGLPPMLAIKQKQGGTNPRSTVGTQTEIHDHLRVLFARVGEVRCFECGTPINQIPLEKIREEILELPERTKVMILAPMVRGRKGKHESVFQQIRKAGLIRVRVNGNVTDIENLPELSPQKNSTIEAITDRIIVRDDIQSRLFEAIETAARLSGGLVVAAFLTPENRETEQWDERLFNALHSCPQCSISYAEIEPRTFSFNSPYGACPSCDGFGVFEQFDPEMVLKNKDQSIAEAVQPWKSLTKAQRQRNIALLDPLLEKIGLDRETPVDQFTADQRQQIWEGFGKQALGVRDLLEKEFVTTKSKQRQDELSNFRAITNCSECRGTRLATAGNSVFINEKTIAQYCRLDLDELSDSLNRLESDDVKNQIATPLIDEIQSRIKYLKNVGLGYLTLDRPTNSLSGGEFQRVRLSTAIGTGLTGVCYVLDEPSIGLHQRDNQRLIQTLRELQSRGNTVIVVEHDEEIMRACDWLIDVGPEAGFRGGEIVFVKPPAQIEKLNGASSRSLTASYLNGNKSIARQSELRPVDGGEKIVLRGASGNNLKTVDLELPLGRFVTVTGVSGSGKSTLIRETLYPAIANYLGLQTRRPRQFDSVAGIEQIEKMVWVDQKPIGRSPRSCLATYCGMFAEIRKIFAQTKMAKSKGYSHSRFSFNNAAGRCGQCDGYGAVKIEMNFLSEMYVPCSVCQGKRFNQETLGVKFKGCSIADVLEMQVDDALSFFDSIPKIKSYLDSFVKIGLGYLSLGQSSTTLSGGEAQRVKLATELAKPQSGNALYLLDEPTTGLHFEDVQRLTNILDGLAAKGNSVVVIEHHLDMIKCSDWVIDLGPEGGDAGGQIVAAGTPQDISEVENSWTGKYLQRMLVN